MPQNIRLWNINNGAELNELSQSRLNLESRLEDWLAADISILDQGLLVIGRQVPTDFGGFIDLLCIDRSGSLVIVELKRDKTPREIVAQALDYASWVGDLSHERISKIAAQYLRPPQSLEEAFRQKFLDDLPETINQDHNILIVASAIDPSSERIIQYLSTIHGVGINAATFQYFQDGDRRELVARVFLMEPDRVEYSTKSKGSSKRTKNLTYEELAAVADERGVGELYRELVELFRPHFDRTRTTVSSIGFVGKYQDSSNSVMLSLIPGESEAESGVCFQLYSKRIAHRFQIHGPDLVAFLPASTREWRYYEGASDDWAGYQGYFRTVEDAVNLVQAWKVHGP